MLFASVSILIPVLCPTAFIVSSKAPASSALSPKADITFCVLSIAVDTSILFSCANLINFPDSSSNFCPVSPNLVFTSPIAAPAVSKSVGIEVARFFMLSCISFKALPDASVFWTIISIPLSTSLKADKDAAPIATIGAVT